MPPSRGVKKPKEDKTDHRVLANRYRVEKKLGSGNFGTAYLVYDMKANKSKGEEEWKVLKEISCGDLAPDETVDAMHEAKLLSKLHHPNIVRFHDSFLDGEFFCIITEYCEGGDLDDKITAWKKAGKSFDTSVIMDWFVQLVLAVQHMHKRRVLHRDLKTRNIFLKRNMIKIGDFGISRVLMGTTDMASTFTGTPYYMSPEVLKHEGYNSKSDVWSIACILYELCALQHAFEGQSLMGVMYKIVEGKTPEIPSQYDRSIQEILNVMLERDPSKRPSAAEVTKLPYVARHIEKMRNKIAEFKEQVKDEDSMQVTRDTEELATILREKTHLEDLQNESMKRKDLREPQQVGHHGDGNHGNQVQQLRQQEDPYTHLTPRERMRLRKMQEADRKAQELSMHARSNLVENVMRKETLKGTMGTLKTPAWQGGAGAIPPWARSNPEVYNDPAFHVAPPNAPATYSYEDYHEMSGTGYYEREDIGTVHEGAGYWEREDMGTMKEGTDYRSYDDRPIKPAAMMPSGGDRPITPQKQPINFDDPNLIDATPPGLPPARKNPPTKTNNNNQRAPSPTKQAAGPRKGQSSRKKGQGSGKMIEEVIGSEIPEDADAAETYYSQQDDFESDSENDDDYGALMDVMQDALDKTTTDQNATIQDDTIGLFSPAVRDLKIKNLRAECEKKIGKNSFKKAYTFLKQARFGDGALAGNTMDESEIMNGLRQFVKNPSDCFLIDQLLFLEEQVKMM
ncbi:LOW QUALITY PROTEIN: serine/threonine-protein kinase Nek11-like [Amphiura filiformis]|uniref:LOW QUALITY PROTEIN: serine/threonine-protein kinase Nek11-like n=1 Tax=Amphiura filiformis TaxID=82378 RepID=UPI003B2126D9